MPAPRLLRPLANPALALLWSGLAGSALGDQLFAVVLSWVATAAFGTAAGYLTTLQAAVLTLTLLASGGWADRRGRLAVMIGADLARAAILIGLIAVWPSGGTPPGWSLGLTVVVLAAGMALFRPALQSALPHLAPADLLPATNALLDGTERIARLLGPGLIALIAAWLPLAAFVGIDAATFLLSAAAVAAIACLRRLPPRHAARPGTLASLRGGWRVLRAHPLLGFMLATTGPINGAWSAAYFLGLPLMIGASGGGGVGAYGLVISAYGSTNLLGTLLIGNRPMPARPHRQIFAGNCLGGAGVMLLGLSALLLPPAWQLAGFCAAAALGAAGGPMQDIPVAVLRQTELPPGQIAAAVRCFMLASSLGLLVTLALAPAVFDAFGIAPAVVLCGAIYAGCGVAGLVRFRSARTGSAPSGSPRS